MAFLNKILGKFLGNKADKDMAEIAPILEKIKKEYERIKLMSSDELRAESARIKALIQERIQPEEDRINELKEKVEVVDVQESEKIYQEIDKLEEKIDDKIEEVLNEILPIAFSVVKATAKLFAENEKVTVKASDFDRDLATIKNSVVIEGDNAIWYNKWMAGGNQVTWDMVHYDVQLIGGVVLHQGKVAEMGTGEGKTLVATLAVFLNALAGRGVHLVTVNDYLSKRDSEWMGPIYEFHGLRVDCIDKHQPNSDGRRNAYMADITYGTNNEFGFDYLRDNMAINPRDLVQRKHHYSIVDEVDSVLIDDARTPLIISGPIPKGEIQKFEELKPKVEKLYSAQKNIVNQCLAEARRVLTNPNATKEEKENGAILLLRAHKGLPKTKALIKFLSEEGIKAQMTKAENYHMQDNNKLMHIITDPLFFVIEEKLNSVELTDKGIDLISGDVDDPTFFV
ncbi:MAG TPA: hypothetical protein VK205_07840, partial [Prolixibacteraceae bacterium]|nr:hypothetical protein [Prolixibacteraceae bacterium]